MDVLTIHGEVPTLCKPAILQRTIYPRSKRIDTTSQPNLRGTIHNIP